MDDGYYTPKSISFFEKEKSNGCQSVETLTVANVLVVPTEGHQHSAKLVNLVKTKELINHLLINTNTKLITLSLVLSSVKMAKIGPLENFPLYGILL